MKLKEKLAEDFYNFWYDKFSNTEIDEIEKNAVLHGFTLGWDAAVNHIVNQVRLKYTFTRGDIDDQISYLNDYENEYWENNGDGMLAKEYIEVDKESILNLKDTEV